MEEIKSPSLLRFWLPLFLIVVTLLLVVATVPGRRHVAQPDPTALRHRLGFFSSGHAEADVRTVAAMFRYLVSPEPTLPSTNQVPVQG